MYVIIFKYGDNIEIHWNKNTVLYYTISPISTLQWGQKVHINDVVL